MCVLRRGENAKRTWTCNGKLNTGPKTEQALHGYLLDSIDGEPVRRQSRYCLFKSESVSASRRTKAAWEWHA